MSGTERPPSDGVMLPIDIQFQQAQRVFAEDAKRFAAKESDEQRPRSRFADDRGELYRQLESARNTGAHTVIRALDPPQEAPAPTPAPAPAPLLPAAADALSTNDMDKKKTDAKKQQKIPIAECDLADAISTLYIQEQVIRDSMRPDATEENSKKRERIRKIVETRKEYENILKEDKKDTTIESDPWHRSTVDKANEPNMKTTTTTATSVAAPITSASDSKDTMQPSCIISVKAKAKDEPFDEYGPFATLAIEDIKLQTHRSMRLRDEAEKYSELLRKVTSDMEMTLTRLQSVQQRLNTYFARVAAGQHSIEFIRFHSPIQIGTAHKCERCWNTFSFIVYFLDNGYNFRYCPGCFIRQYGVDALEIAIKYVESHGDTSRSYTELAKTYLRSLGF